MVCCSHAVTREHTPGGLRKELGVPLYHQIQHLLRHRIHSGLYSPGTQIPATSELKTALGLDGAVTELTLIKRLRHIDEEPFSYTLNYLPTEIGARIRIKDLYSLPLLKILQEDLKIPIVRAHETIEAAPADPDTARRLAIPVLYPVLHMTRTMYTTLDRPFELVDIFYRADKYHYSVDMTRVKRQGRWTWTTEVETSA